MTPRFLSELTWTRHCHSDESGLATHSAPGGAAAPPPPVLLLSPVRRVRHAAAPATVDPARAGSRVRPAPAPAPVSGRPGRDPSSPRTPHEGGCGFIPQNALKNAQLPNRQSTPKVRTNAALVWQLSRYFAFSEYLFGRHVLSLARDADGATWPPPSSTQLPLAGSSTAMQLGIAFAMPWPGIRRARCSAQSHPSFQTRKASPRR